MDVFVADLEEDAAVEPQEFSGDCQPVPDVVQIRVDAVFPSIPECFDLFGLSRDLADFPVFDRAVAGRPLEVAIEFYSIRRVEVKSFGLARSALLFRRGWPLLSGCRRESFDFASPRRDDSRRRVLWLGRRMRFQRDWIGWIGWIGRFEIAQSNRPSWLLDALFLG